MLLTKYIKVWLVSLFSLIVFASQGQSNSVGFYGTVNDYTGGLNGFKFNMFRFQYYKPGPEIIFQQYLSPFFDLREAFSYDWVQYETPPKTAGVDAQFLSGDLILRFKFANGYALPIDAPVAPFLEFGAGGTFIKSHQFVADHTRAPIAEETHLNALAGIGLSFRVSETVNFEIASKVYMPMLNGWDGRYQINNDIWSNAIYTQESLGFNVVLRGRALDSDHDGVPDTRDLCPNTPAGVKVDSHGCPLDFDGDGIPDYLDKCPRVPGLAMYQGCPTGRNSFSQNNGDPDSDGDGVPDSRDKCANTPINTPVDANGCPFKQAASTDLDSDGDGVPDRIDKCPNTPGPASNRGCPEIKESVQRRLRFATRGIYFETDKAIIKQQSYSMLDEIVDILNQYPDYNIRLSGHTDNVGGDAYNLNLSQNRVDAVMQYLIEKGIPASRLEAIGYGKTRPIASNNTAMGRALNRRVEIELYLK